MVSFAFWAKKGTYPPRPGNEIEIFIDGQAAYSEIAAAFRNAKKFIYVACKEAGCLKGAYIIGVLHSRHGSWMVLI
jgi:hypothetical protein